MRIRQGNPQDAQAIDAFDCFGGDRPAALNQGRCLVAQIDGQIAGFVVYKPSGLIGRNFVEFLVVSEAYRRRGVAIALLRAVEKTLGPCRLFISTEADNAPMLTLLDADGWTPAGQIQGVNDSGFAELFFYREANAPSSG